MKQFSLNIICMKFKTWLIIKYFRKICCSLVSSNKTLLIITWCGHTFMLTLSQTMYLFEANLNLLADTSTPDLERYHLGYSLTANCLRCWSTGLTEREIPMQYYTTMEMYTDKCMENQVCNYCTHRWNNVSEVLSGDSRLTIYFRFKVLHTLQNNMSR